MASSSGWASPWCTTPLTYTLIFLPLCGRCPSRPHVAPDSCVPLSPAAALQVLHLLAQGLREAQGEGADEEGGGMEGAEAGGEQGSGSRRSRGRHTRGHPRGAAATGEPGPKGEHRGVQSAEALREEAELYSMLAAQVAPMLAQEAPHGAPEGTPLGLPAQRLVLAALQVRATPKCRALQGF